MVMNTKQGGEGARMPDLESYKPRSISRTLSVGLIVTLVWVAGLFLALGGCAGKPVNKTLQAEEALAAAGFQLKMADTPAKVDRISRIPQKKVVRVRIKDREVYLWADATGCRCYYKGTRHNYEQLLENRWEEKADQRTYWYQDQHEDMF
jgi:hypothetical protein